MGKNMSVSLDEHFTAFVEQQVAEGRYASANEVVRTALTWMEEDEAQLKALEAALIEGEESGADPDYNIDRMIDEARREFLDDQKASDAAA